MSADNNVLHSLLAGLPQDDKLAVIHSIESAREVQIEQKLHPRRRRRRNANGVLEPLPNDASRDSDSADESFDEFSLSD